MKTRLLLLFAFITFYQVSEAQKQFWSQSNIETALPANSDWNSISHLKIFQLDHKAFHRYLLVNVAPEQAKAKAFPLDLPMPDGSLRTFYITESSNMEPELAAKFPDIRSYKGTDGSNYMRMSISPFGFQAYILTSDGDIIIEAIDKKDLNRYGVFHSKDLQIDVPLQLGCGSMKLSELENPVSDQKKYEMRPRSGAALVGNPVDLRTYRLAITCTGEWGARPDLGGGSVASAIAKMVASMDYVNAVYNRDVAVHMNLIANNNLLIYLDGNLDPYPVATVGGQLLGMNTQVINAKVGASAYDIGHIYTIGCSDVGGVASLGSVCAGNKGAGVTCWYTSDIAYVTQRIVCHEMGHQFEASHTFSNCNGNEAGTSYEPGSGTSIMSYSGLCGPDLNVETGNLPHPNYFHINSVERILHFTRNGGGSCGKSSVSGNTFPIPEILFPSGLYIPIRTPFILRGRATDMENDSMSYNWEQYDAGGYGPALGQPSLTEEGPLFKSVFPGSSPVRIVPVWNTVLNRGNFERTEVLPTVSREISFRFNVRDNHPGAGGTAWKETFFRSLESAGPFTVTYPNYPQSDTLFVGVCNKIQWDVANTYNSLVNCKKVNIYLMPNRTNPGVLIPLAMNTDNDGQEMVDIPDTLSGLIRSRIMVEAADNIFFDVSDADIRIINPTSQKLNFGVSPSNLTFCVPNSTDIQIRTCATSSFNGDVQLFVESGLPDKASYSFQKSTLNATDNTVLHLDFSQVVSSGISNLVVAAVTSSGDTLREVIQLDLVSVDYSDLKTVYPADGLSGLAQTIEFQWNRSKNATSYTLEVATSPAFGNTVIYTIGGLTGNTFKPNVLFSENKLYFWRIIPSNRCGLGAPSIPSPFHTVNKSCAATDYPGNILSRRANQTGFMLTPIREAGIISDVNVKNFKATAVGVNSVTLTLVSPSGTKARLFDRNCGVTDQFDCSFDDDGTFTLINPSNACPPTQGKLIKPLESLSKFNGEDKKGDWKIEVATDHLLSGFADFKFFSLDICSELIISSPFLVHNLGLYMNVKETKGIGKDLLFSQDNDNTPSELTYTIMAIPNRGDLLINGVVATYGSKFTQKDIDDGRLSYKHKGNDQEVDGFLFTVEDGTGGWFGSEYFRIQIGAVGTTDEKNPLAVKVYPNPAKGFLQISSEKSLDKDAMLRFFNLQGNLVLKKEIGLLKADVLDVRNLSDGIYLLEVRSGKDYSTHKVLIRN
jgi:hypothetical protein